MILSIEFHNNLFRDENNIYKVIKNLILTNHFSEGIMVNCQFNPIPVACVPNGSLKCLKTGVSKISISLKSL